MQAHGLILRPARVLHPLLRRPSLSTNTMGGLNRKKAKGIRPMNGLLRRRPRKGRITEMIVQWNWGPLRARPLSKKR